MKRVTAFAAIAVVLAGAAVAAEAEPPGAQLLPPGPGRQATLTRCAACHALDVVANKRAAPGEWFAIVEDMKGRGAVLTDDEALEIAVYLGKALPAAGEPGGR